MLHAYHRTVAVMASDRSLKYLIRDYFALPQGQALMPALLAKRLEQADLVLCLLHLRDRHSNVRPTVEQHIAELIGHPITTCPGCLRRYREVSPYIALDRTPRIVYVTPHNPRQTNTDAYLRWKEYKVGRSIAQLKLRGVRPKDIRIARRNGWIKLEALS